MFTVLSVSPKWVLHNTLIISSNEYSIIYELIEIIFFMKIIVNLDSKNFNLTYLKKEKHRINITLSQPQITQVNYHKLTRYKTKIRNLKS